MRTIDLLLFAGLILMLLICSSCTMGPDATPDVTAHAASFGGFSPTFDARGRMTGVAPSGAVNNSARRNIFE